jgi:hypothetical protein
MSIHAAAAAESPAPAGGSSPATSASVREQLHATTRALIAAEEAQPGEAVRSVAWKRRGLLRRLVRLEHG